MKSATVRLNLEELAELLRCLPKRCLKLVTKLRQLRAQINRERK